MAAVLRWGVKIRFTAVQFTAIVMAFGVFTPSGFSQIRFQIPDQAFTKADFWEESAFTGEFLPKESPTYHALKAWSERPDVFEVPTHGIWGRFIDDKLISLTVLFLDSGTHFGYVPKENAAETEVSHRKRFKELFTQVDQRVEVGLISLSEGKKPTAVSLGKSPMLMQEVLIYKTGNLYARLHRVDEQLIKVTWFKSLKEAQTWGEINVSPDFSTAAKKEKNGDVVISGIPILPQGDRAYCGVSALAMVTQYLGVNAETEDYAAAAGIRYGSTKESFIREVYDAAADEAGYRLEILPTVNGQVIKKSISAGIPIVVWRRWNQQRDFLHSVFLKKFKKNPDSTLPEPNANDRASWPDQNSYNHASVITGFNAARNEVIFTETWSESVRNRRMRLEEISDTSYAAFVFHPAESKK